MKNREKGISEILKETKGTPLGDYLEGVIYDRLRDGATTGFDLSGAFVWYASPEGHDFWCDVNQGRYREAWGRIPKAIPTLAEPKARRVGPWWVSCQPESSARRIGGRSLSMSWYRPKYIVLQLDRHD